MWNDYIFEILEIEPTYDAKKIKKAYANLVKKYHPEEYPEKWKKIHDAYETALALAKKEEYLDGRVEMPEPVVKSGEAKIPPRPTQENPPEPVMKSGKTGIPPRLSAESDEMDALFDNIEALSREQLDRIEQYRKDRNITEDSAGVSDPIGYARGKISNSCKAQRRMRDLADGARTLFKAAGWLLVALLSVSGLYLRMARHTGGTAQQRQRQYEQNVERDREIIERIEEIQLIGEQQNKIKEELSQSIELVEAGDTREKMISLYGEPDSSQVDPRNPDYEKAVYHLDEVDMTITLYLDVIISVYYEASQDESKGE